MLNVELNCCRICLGTHNLKDIFTGDGVATISGKIMYCASVQVSPEDSLPSKICTKCALYLEIAYVFRTVCEWTDSKLRQETTGQSDPFTRTSTLAGNSNLGEEVRAVVLLHLNQRDKARAVNCGDKEAAIDNCNLNLQMQTNICDIVNIKNCRNDGKDISNEGNGEKDHSKQQSKTSFKLNILDDKEKGTFVDSANSECTKAHQIGCHKNGSINERINIKNLLTSSEIVVKVKNKDLIYGKLHINNRIRNQVVDTLDLMSNDCNNRLSSSESNLTDEQSDYDWAIDYEKEHVTKNECLNAEQNHFDHTAYQSRDRIIVEVGKDSSLEVCNDKQHLEDEFELSFEATYDEITFEQSGREEKLFNKDFKNKNFTKNNENYHSETKKLVNDINTIISRENKNNLFKENNQIKKRVVVERHILLDEANDSVAKGVDFECQAQDNFYNDKAILLNNEDPLLSNEKSGLGNNSAEDLNIACLQKEDTFNENLEMQFNELGSKSAFLKNVLLHDFENFEREKLIESNSKAVFHSDTALELYHNFSETRASFIQSENRVGRHIAKKNAGQPPKRYSRTTLSSPKRAVGQNFDQNLKDDPPIEKQINIDEIRDQELNLENVILDQQYILEGDLSMPEPIFEETVVTDSFGSVDDDSQLFDDNYSENHEIKNGREKHQVGRRQKRNKIASRKVTKHCMKSNIVSNQTKQIHEKLTTTNTEETILDNKCNTRPNTKATAKYDISNSSDSQELVNYIPNDANDTDYSSEDDYEEHHDTLSKRSHSIKKTSKHGNMNTTCKVCNKSFPFPSHLQRHLTAHIGVKRFSCSFCGKQFLHSYNLSVHMRSHTGDFPLKCNICSRGFASPSVLERHKRSHTGETPFQCRLCLQLFSHASSLNMHEKMHLDRPSFTCDVCFKIFSYKSSLTAHKKGHSGLKAHSCSICCKRFTRRTSVMRHMSCHADAKKFKCRTCGDVFSSQRSLVKHRKIHSGARTQ